MALHKPEHSKWWYWVSWPILALAYALLFPFAYMIVPRSPSDRGKIQWDSKFLQDWEDWIDDPIDWLKYKLFGIGKLP